MMMNQFGDVFSLQMRQIRQRQEAEATEELNRLMGGALKKQDTPQDRDRQRDSFGEDGFPEDEDEPLEYVNEQEAEQLPFEEVQVVYKRIAIRKRPSGEAKVIGTAELGQTLRTFGWDDTGSWRKIHYKLRGGWGSTVAAWVMHHHPKLGVLLKCPGETAAELPVQDTGLPAAAAAVLAADAGAAPIAAAIPQKNFVPISAGELEDAASELEKLEIEHAERWSKKKEKKQLSELELLKGAKQEESEGEDTEPPALPTTSPEGFTYATVDEMLEAADHGGMQYQVVQKPSAEVRSMAGAKGKTVTTVPCRSYVYTFGWEDPTKKKYRKIFCSTPDNRVVVAWMRVEHPELGIQLELAVG
eukprot:CAMPEP_0179101228 /NCGR_PEP_ID=MMETSP0796-20121207/46793_1 /TAXON_ID=73915 /ORGANISM="Pyrodinium bahamense, Strain pbaha01" /LENGTH=357 /DNA_ID=CAMNT_0020799075 /DNA_START=79 /DNA_END=1152 /DNA_ORIENTATION=+